MRQEIVKLGSYVSCIDTTGIIMVKIFKSNVPCYNKCVDLGDTIIVRIIGKNIKTKFLQDIKIKFRFRRGSLHKAIVVHTKNLYKRANRRYI
jgi:ribosomal protein L14